MESEQHKWCERDGTRMVHKREVLKETVNHQKEVQDAVTMTMHIL